MISDPNVGRTNQKTLRHGHHDIGQDSLLIANQKAELPAKDLLKLLSKPDGVDAPSHWGHLSKATQDPPSILQELHGSPPLAVQLRIHQSVNDRLGSVPVKAQEMVCLRIHGSWSDQVQEVVSWGNKVRHRETGIAPVLRRLHHGAVVDHFPRIRREQKQVVEKHGNLLPRLVNRGDDGHVILLAQQSHVPHALLRIRGAEARGGLIAKKDLGAGG
mmetsp:Transcript_28599/g.68018  ORF Transcript_28599/g.68018 Transcript_28599/m.68018 type:complete len:216 (-) Transcript_28599:939-1586(-)